jgi:hypothetical protein
MTPTLFALSRSLLLAALCAVAYFIGYAILRRLIFSSVAERLSLCIAFGLGVLSHWISLIDLFRLANIDPRCVERCDCNSSEHRNFFHLSFSSATTDTASAGKKKWRPCLKGTKDPNVRQRKD